MVRYRYVWAALISFFVGLSGCGESQFDRGGGSASYRTAEQTSAPATSPAPAPLSAHGRAARLSEQPAEPVPGVAGVTVTSSAPAFTPAREQRAVDPQARTNAPAKGPEQGTGPGMPGDRYALITEDPFVSARDNPLSTFSIDVDTASYSKTRMYLLQHETLPPVDAVRIEELVNYFDYNYEPPTDQRPFAVHVELTEAPWRAGHRLARVGIKGREVERARTATNLVFLIDVSGSMDYPNRLPLVVDSLRLLTSQLGEQDRVAIAVYAGAAGVVLPPTCGADRHLIVEALDRLRAGGSTNGGEGIRLAYQLARSSFLPAGANRVILCTDGDFNVGTTNVGQLVRLAETEARAGVFLTVLGFGMGNHNDAMLEELSNRANGNYAFIDTIDESRKVLGEQLQGTLVTIAKDVKIQVEFNPSHVSAYRLIGYENRRLAAQDFNDDRKDAGEIGAGHTVTALYELVPWGEGEPQLTTPVDPLKYQQRSASGAGGDELMTVKLRYKEPASDVSERLEVPVPNQPRLFSTASRDLQFAAAVAEFGMLLRHSPHCGNASYAGVLEIARGASQPDPYGYRSEFLQLVAAAQRLSGEPASQPFGSNWLPTPRSAQPITRLSVSPTVSAPAKSWDGFDVMLAGIAVLGGLCAFGASLSIVGVILWQARCAASP